MKSNICSDTIELWEHFHSFAERRQVKMYLTVKQQVKHLSKEDYQVLKELCHVAKNLTNEAIYNVRQYYFKDGRYLNYQKN